MDYTLKNAIREAEECAERFGNKFVVVSNQYGRFDYERLKNVSGSLRRRVVCTTVKGKLEV